MLEISRTAVPVLVMVTVCAVDCVFSATLPNESVAGSTVTVVELTPVPLRVTDSTLFDPSVIWRLSDRLAAVVGLNATPTVQLADAARLPGQLLEAIRKSVPVASLMLAIVTVELLLLVTVTF